MKRSYPFIAKALPYEYYALRPVISEETLYYHYEKHYKNYVNNLNQEIEANPDYMGLSLEEILLKSHNNPEDIKISRAAGGVYNHEMYFESLAPAKFENNRYGCESLWRAVEADFISREIFVDEIIKSAIEVFGSGYSWVASDQNGKIFIAKYANQNTPITQGALPLLPIDVWEHAYYLDYRHNKADYVNRIFDIIDWEVVENRYCEKI